MSYVATSRFLSALPEAGPGGIAIFGVPYDGTTSFRPGARFGPRALREASDGLETYSPYQDLDLEDLDYCDLGDLELEVMTPAAVRRTVTHHTQELLDGALRPLLLGGEHAVSVGAIEAVAERWPDLLLVQLDAHADLRDGYLGEPESHASAMRRCLDFLEHPIPLLQVGIRSGTRDEFSEMREQDRLVAPNALALQDALRLAGERPIYLSVDLDVFDPAVMPGTGTPEPGGILWDTFARLLEVIPGGELLVGADVVELAPGLDPSGISSVLAAKVVREILLKMGE